MFTIKDNYPVFLREINGKSENALRNARAAMRRGMMGFEGDLAATYMSGRPGLKAPKGDLRRSWHVKTFGFGTKTDGMSGGVSLSTSSKYAHIHSDAPDNVVSGGKNVLRSNGKWLTVPLNDEAKRIRAEYSSLRSAKDLFAIKSDEGNLLLVKDSGSGITPMFVLRKQVKMPQRLKLFAHWASDGPKYILSELQRMVKRAYNG